MKFIFDSSAFAKRYILEKGSKEVNKLLKNISQLGLSTLVVSEVSSALSHYTVYEIKYLEKLPPLGSKNDPLLAKALALITGHPNGQTSSHTISVYANSRHSRTATAWQRDVPFARIHRKTQSA